MNITLVYRKRWWQSQGSVEHYADVVSLSISQWQRKISLKHHSLHAYSGKSITRFVSQIEQILIDDIPVYHQGYVCAVGVRRDKYSSLDKTLLNPDPSSSTGPVCLLLYCYNQCKQGVDLLAFANVQHHFSSESSGLLHLVTENEHNEIDIPLIHIDSLAHLPLPRSLSSVTATPYVAELSHITTKEHIGDLEDNTSPPQDDEDNNDDASATPPSSEQGSVYF